MLVFRKHRIFDHIVMCHSLHNVRRSVVRVGSVVKRSMVEIISRKVRHQLFKYTIIIITIIIKMRGNNEDSLITHILSNHDQQFWNYELSRDGICY